MQLGRLRNEYVNMDTTDGIYAGKGISCVSTVFFINGQEGSRKKSFGAGRRLLQGSRDVGGARSGWT